MRPGWVRVPRRHRLPQRTVDKAVVRSPGKDRAQDVTDNRSLAIKKMYDGMTYKNAIFSLNVRSFLCISLTRALNDYEKYSID